jgi:NAD(P)-dependent dehydrogenase (short-subunit alcohol dehydrogenase family)
LKNNKSGSIVNISSTAGLFGFPQRTPYAASKWAIIGLTKSLAMELGKYKIRVNAICPGSVKGDRMKRVINSKAKLLKTTPNKIQKEFESMTSITSFVTKEDIASMIIYLLSDQSKNISGQSISVDGHTERMI